MIDVIEKMELFLSSMGYKLSCLVFFFKFKIAYLQIAFVLWVGTQIIKHWIMFIVIHWYILFAANLKIYRVVNSILDFRYIQTYINAVKIFRFVIICTWEANGTSFQVKFNNKHCNYHID
jgi:hypothetical protein